MENFISYLIAFLIIALPIAALIFIIIGSTKKERISIGIFIEIIVVFGIFISSGIIESDEILNAVISNAERNSRILNALSSNIDRIIIIIGIGALITLTNRIILIIKKYNFRKNSEKIKKNYPKLSSINIMRERKDNQKFETIYLLIIATIIYIFTSKIFDFPVNNIFLYVLIGSIFLIALELLILNYRVNKGWYGSSELEAREIIEFITKNAEDIDFTDGNSPKSIIRPEDIQQIGEELGIQFPGYPESNAMNKGFSEG